MLMLGIRQAATYNWIDSRESARESRGTVNTAVGFAAWLSPRLGRFGSSSTSTLNTSCFRAGTLMASNRVIKALACSRVDQPQCGVISHSGGSELPPRRDGGSPRGTGARGLAKAARHGV